MSGTGSPMPSEGTNSSAYAAATLAYMAEDWLRRLERDGAPPPGEDVRHALAVLALETPDTAGRCPRLMRLAATTPVAFESRLLAGGSAADETVYVTVQDAADTLEIAADSVRAAIRRGHLTAARRGGRWLVPVAAIESYRGQRGGVERAVECWRQ